jgi:predicted O-methyltransferase YrrM
VNWEAEYQARRGTWSDVQDHLPFLYDVTCGYHEPAVIELGVRTGFSTAAFLAAAAKAGGTVHSADIEQPRVPGEWLEDPSWHFVPGDDLSAAVTAALPARCDVLFIDTLHSREHTLAELEEYMPRVAPGGIALFHDTHLPVPPLIADPGYPVGGVKEALDEWCARTGQQWHDRAGSYGLGIIRA